jgi:hypothetical protein
VADREREDGLGSGHVYRDSFSKASDSVDCYKEPCIDCMDGTVVSIAAEEEVQQV